MVRYVNIFSNLNNLVSLLDPLCKRHRHSSFQATILATPTLHTKPMTTSPSMTICPTTYTPNQTYNPISWLNFTLPLARDFSFITIAMYDDSRRNVLD